jgi:protein SCO1/2
MRRSATLLVVALTALGSRSAYPHPDPVPADPSEAIAAPPPTYKANEVAVVERLGVKVPLDAHFRTAEGKHVTLGEILASAGNTMPTILTFNYSDCPMLCSLQLNGLSAVLPKLAEPTDGVGFRVGAQFRIVTIDLEPTDSPEKAQKMREKYLAKLPAGQRATARAGWTFLVADDPSFDRQSSASRPPSGAATLLRTGDPTGLEIRRVADAVGFTYVYVPERAEWAHPAALIFLSTTGVVTRYVYGIEFATAMMRESLYKAGMAEPATAVGFMNRCYHYDPDASSHARDGVLAMRIGAAGFLVLLVSGLVLLHFLRKHRRLEPSHVEMKS